MSELCDAELNALCALSICALIWLISPEFEPCAAALAVCDVTCASCAWSDAIRAFNSSSSLDEELLEDAAPPPPPTPPARDVAEVPGVEVDEVPLLDVLVDEPVVLSPFEFDDAVPEEAPVPGFPAFEAEPPVVPLP